MLIAGACSCNDPDILSSADERMSVIYTTII